MNNKFKFLSIFLIIMCLCACNKSEGKKSIEQAKYPSGYELSLGYGLPTITFEDDYDDWDLNLDYFGGKKVDEAYYPKYDSYKARIAVYRHLIEEGISLEQFAQNSIINNAYDINQNISLLYFEDDIPYAYYSVIKEINNDKYLAQEYFYLGSNEYVNLEYLTPMSQEEIVDTELTIYVPATYTSADNVGYIYSYVDDNNILPSIYVSRQEIEAEYITEQQGEYITTLETDIDFAEFNYEDIVTSIEEESVDYHEQLANYLANINTLFDISEENYSSLKYQETDIETLNLKYTYINNETRYIAYETNIGIDNYIYTICLCAYEDLPIQNANAKLLLNTVCFK